LLGGANSGVDVAFLFRLGWDGDGEELLDLLDVIGTLSSWKSEGSDKALFFPASET